jgi:hypothetical protein
MTLVKYIITHGCEGQEIYALMFIYIYVCVCSFAMNTRGMGIHACDWKFGIVEGS